MGDRSLVAWLGPYPNSLEVWVGSCHAVLVLTCPGCVIWGVLMVSLQDRWNLVIINASVLCGVLGYPKGSAAELLDGSLKLRYCTAVFTKQIPPPPPSFSTLLPPWSLPKVGNGGGKRWDVTPGHSSDDRSSTVKSVRLTRKTRPSVLADVIPKPGHSTQWATPQDKTVSVRIPNEQSDVCCVRKTTLSCGNVSHRLRDQRGGCSNVLCW